MTAARREFGDRGYSGTKVEHLVAASGVNAPTLYHHFGNKEGLFLKVARLAYEEVLEAFEAGVEDRNATSLTEAVDALLNVSIAMMAKDASLPKLFLVIQFELPRHPELRDHLRPVLRKFGLFFDRLAALSADELVANDDDRRYLGRALSAVITGLSSEAVLLGSTTEYAKVVDRMRALILPITRVSITG